MKSKLFCLAMLCFLPSVIMGQKKQFTIDDLLPGGSTYYQNTVPENLYFTWWGDICVRLETDKCYTVNPMTGTEIGSIATLDYINLILARENKKPISSLLYSTMPNPDKQQILVQRTDGVKYLIDLLKEKVVWFSVPEKDRDNDDLEEISLNLAYTRNHNLYVLDASGEVHQISNDGCNDIRYGESVHRDEFGISKGTFWNPDGSLLAFYRMDQSMVSTYPQVNVTPQGGDSRCAQLVPDKYPMAGETSHKVTVGVYSLSSKKTIYLQAGDPTDRYFTNIAWSPKGDCVYMIELNRDQNHGELVCYNAYTGEKIRTVFTEDNEKYFEPCAPIQFLPWDENKFIYLSRRDGYNHIYLYNKDGKMLKQLTKGNYEVFDVLGFNKETQTVIYTSNQLSPIQKNVSILNMKGKTEVLGNTTGWHNPKLSVGGKYIVDNFSSPLFPRHIDLINTETGETANIFSAKDKWQDFKVPKITLGTLKSADGKHDLYYRLILPPDFDKNKKYPAVVYVYGGPHAHNIDASFHYGARGWDIWMAQKGYVMFCLDNRGSEHRGLEFEQVTFRNLGVEEMKDQMKGVDYLKSLSYVDSTRLGVHGWSFGGFMTTSLMTTYPDVFKCGVAGGPVIDWKYYEVMYGERYMDTPESNPEGYKNTSLLNKAGNLKGRLMVIYGGNDPTCVPQHTLSFIRACIDAGTYPDLFTYPGDGHNMYGTDRIHLHNVITRYFEEHLK